MIFLKEAQQWKPSAISSKMSDFHVRIDDECSSQRFAVEGFRLICTENVICIFYYKIWCIIDLTFKKVIFLNLQ